MKDAVHTRAYIIDNYVQSAEEYLEAFAQSDEVKNLLKNPQSPEYTSRAQEYTVEFAKVKGVFEGLYIATPETLVLTHTSEGVVGITTRSGDGLTQLQENILSRHELTNTGILKSPSTGNMCISMYYPIYDGDTCIGFVGAAVLANELMNSLLSLEVKGLPNSQYVFINAKTGEYLYHEDEEMLCTVTEDKGYLEIMEMVKKEGADTTGIYSYVDDKGVEQVVVYQYLPERDWLFAIRDTHASVYNSLDEIKKVTALNCAIVMVIVILCLVIILTRLSVKLGLISKAIAKLGDMDLSADSYLEKYSGKKDEVGIVCDALKVTCMNLESSNASELVTISKEKMEELSKALADINHASEAIEGISSQIEGIAKQTNILALNAMVEAARAGDAGLGFGVVADEIRILATQSNEASVNAYNLIQETQKSVEIGIKIGEETSEYLTKVVTQTETIDEEVTKIANTTMLQNERVMEISKRLE